MALTVTAPSPSLSLSPPPPSKEVGKWVEPKREGEGGAPMNKGSKGDSIKEEEWEEWEEGGVAGE